MLVMPVVFRDSFVDAFTVITRKYMHAKMQTDGQYGPLHAQ